MDLLGRHHSKAENVIHGSMTEESSQSALSSDVQIRVFSVESVSSEERELYRRLLSPDELLHLSHLKSDASQLEFLVSHGALRESLAGLFECRCSLNRVCEGDVWKTVRLLSSDPSC